MITTILGYLEHASYRKNFSRAFVPWYIGRPIMGMLLGLVFYFVIKGGLWALVFVYNRAPVLRTVRDSPTIGVK